MTLDKGIKHGKEHRKGYKERGKPGACDVTCRPHGGGYKYACPYCEGNRLFAEKKMHAKADQDEREED